jgi:tetratricopeptide (TPR) repeat protein
MPPLVRFRKYRPSLNFWATLLLACGLPTAVTVYAQMSGSAPASSAAPATAGAMEQANQLYSAKNWSAAAQAFAAITLTQPANALAWLRLGVSRHKLGQYESAIEAYKHIEADPQLGPSTLYREAASLAKVNRKGDAIAALNKAVDAGLTQPDLFQKDEDLASLRDDAAFKKIIEKADAVAHPCAHQPEYRQFDFWIGEWDVVTTQGHNPAGTSSIQLILDQCVVLENWTGGGTGKSFNHYDTRMKKWIQDWVDSQSNSVHFEGGLENGVMSYFADSADAQGAPIRRHMQFIKIDADHVRQFSQASSDGGKTWLPEYDFTYIRKK